MPSHSRIDIQEPPFGAGIWHFGRYVDRYATDGYGPPVSTLEVTDLTGQVDDLSVVDLTFPSDPPDLPLDEVKTALKRNGPQALAVTPEIYTRRFVRGAFTNPDPQVRRQAIEPVSQGAETARELGCDYVKLWPGQDGWDYVKLWPGQDGWDYPFQADHSELWRFSLDAVRDLPAHG